MLISAVERHCFLYVATARNPLTLGKPAQHGSYYAPESLGRLLEYVSRSKFATLEAHGVIHPDEGWHDVYVPRNAESWVPGGM